MLHIMGKILAFAANSGDHRVIARPYHHKKPFFRLDGARKLSHALDMVGLFCVSRRVFNLRVVGPDVVRDVPDFLVTLRRGPMLYNRLLEAPDQAALGFDGKLLELLLGSLGLRLSDFTTSVSDDPRGCDGMTGAGQLGGDTFETGDCRCMELPQWPDACLAILVTSTELHSTGWRTGRCL